MSRAALLHHSQSKDGLKLAAIERIFEGLQSFFRHDVDGKAPLTWVAGVYLFDERGDIDSCFGLIPITPQIPALFGVQRFQQDPVTSKSDAVFGQAHP